ncbi:MAG: ribose 5-phosphate isomerase B [Bacteroidetes bacterium]|nr:MAG: ribose 5-phosphate isomerase B [Bacteroidota bacterium]PTM20399.1 MAG: ribose 5-phosphate isomerase B [Bacteroidota bacterium]
MKIPIASDHAGYPAKEIIKKLLEEMGHTPVDFGTHSEESVDYPEYSHEVSQRVRDGEFETGILVCGSGQGVCMTANKYEGIRAALVYNEQVAERSRSHNDANVLCLPGRELDDTQLAAILKAWLDTPFEGGRHQRRVEKIHKAD